MKYNNEPYGHHKMLSIDGNFLAITNKKRMNWYLTRGLAIMVNDNDYQLTFVANCNDNTERAEFFKVGLENKCVVCGTEKDLTRHHVVPTQYRTYLPLNYKSKNSYDVVCVCNKCHNNYEREADKLNDELIKKAGLSKYTKKNIHSVKAFNKLKYHSKWLETAHKFELTQWLEYELDDTIENILKKDELEFPKLSELIINEVDDYKDFVIMWRKHFLEITKPKFITQEWLDGVETIF